MIRPNVFYFLNNNKETLSFLERRGFNVKDLESVNLKSKRFLYVILNSVHLPNDGRIYGMLAHEIGFPAPKQRDRIDMSFVEKRMKTTFPKRFIFNLCGLEKL